MADKICQININGMSQNTIKTLEQYVWSENIDIVCLLETKLSELPIGVFSNMRSIIKPNPINPYQRGVALLTKDNIQLTRYPDLEPHSADTLVTVAKVGTHRLYICSVYSPPRESTKLEEILQATASLKNKMATLKVDGILLIGDLNARHETWSDHGQNSSPF